MPRPLDPNVLIIDVESTCWEPPEYQPQNESSEIIEIGIAVVNIKDFKVTKNESILVRPQKSKVSKFCTKLTTLTQKQVDTGIIFQDAMTKLLKDFDSSNRTFVSWGDYDRKMFERNCRDYGAKYPFGPRHMNLKNSFTMLHGLDKEPGLDQALDYLGMKLEGTHHRGIDDAKNIARIFIHTLKKFRGSDFLYNKAIDKGVENLIKWRDDCALDWYGEDLVYHIRGILGRYLEFDDIPPGHESGFEVYGKFDESEKLDVIRSVLKKRGSY